MRKNKKLINTLIKRKNLIGLMKSVGVKRISFGAIEFLEKKFEKDMLKFCLRLKEELDINGKKILENKDIENVIKELEEKEDFEY